MNEKKPDFEIISWESLRDLIEIIAKKVKESGYKPDIIIGLARGGWAIARLLCDYLTVKHFVSLNVNYWGVLKSSHDKSNLFIHNLDLSKERILIVDDVNKDRNMEKSVEFLKKLKPIEIRTLALIYIKDSGFMPDYYAKKISRRGIIFPWNYMEEMINYEAIRHVKTKLNQEEKLEGLRRRFFQNKETKWENLLY